MNSSITEVDELAKRVLADTGVSGELPIDVNLVARRLGMVIRHERLYGAAGMLRMDDNHVVVALELTNPWPRVRFTLAHEIGHYLLATYPDEVAAVWHAKTSLREPERFCNHFAESLLLPTEWVTNELRSRPQTLERLIWVAQAAGVSLSVASVRVTRIAAWRLTLLRLTRRARRWILLAVSGHRCQGWQDLEIMPDTSLQLDEATGRDVSKPFWLPLGLRGAHCYAPAQLTKQRERAFAWVNLLACRETPGPDPTSVAWLVR